MHTDMIHVCTVCICDIFNNIIITCIKDMIHYVATYMCTCTRIVPCTVILYTCVYYLHTYMFTCTVILVEYAYMLLYMWPHIYIYLLTSGFF